MLYLVRHCSSPIGVSCSNDSAVNLFLSSPASFFRLPLMLTFLSANLSLFERSGSFCVFHRLFHIFLLLSLTSSTPPSLPLTIPFSLSASLPLPLPPSLPLPSRLPSDHRRLVLWLLLAHLFTSQGFSSLKSDLTVRDETTHCSLYSYA